MTDVGPEEVAGDAGVPAPTDYDNTVEQALIEALRLENARLREQLARQRVWAQVGMRGKAEDDQANADKLVAIDKLVADLEAECDALRAKAALAVRMRPWLDYVDVYGTAGAATYAESQRLQKRIASEEAEIQAIRDDYDALEAGGAP